MKEIEVRAHLRDKKLVLAKLESLGCVLSEPIRQVDTVYAKIVGNVKEYLTNDHFVRIREKSDGKFLFTVKKPSAKTLLSKTEHETEIKNVVELEKAVFLMGYKVANRLVKVRRTAHYGQNEICIDDVEGLGSFIEIEEMSDKDEDVVRKKLRDFLMSLGVSAKDEVDRGYDIMAIEQGL